MLLFKELMDCHERLVSAAEALRDQLAGTTMPATLPGLRLKMACAARENLIATQRLWSRIEREIPQIEARFPKYRDLRLAETDLHARYAHHIAAWPLSAIAANFETFSAAKRRFLDDMIAHRKMLSIDFFEPACLMLETTVPPAGAALSAAG